MTVVGVPIKGGRCKMVVQLRSVALLDSSFSQVCHNGVMQMIYTPLNKGHRQQLWTARKTLSVRVPLHQTILLKGRLDMGLASRQCLRPVVDLWTWAWMIAQAHSSEACNLLGFKYLWSITVDNHVAFEHVRTSRDQIKQTLSGNTVYHWLKYSTCHEIRIYYGNFNDTFGIEPQF